jgi:hypothetical protein
MAIGDGQAARNQEIERHALVLLEESPAPRRAVVDETMHRAGVNREAAEAALERLLSAGRAEVFRTADGAEEIRLPLL